RSGHRGPSRDHTVPINPSTRRHAVAQVRRSDADIESRITPEPQGIAFGLPRIGIPGGSTTRWSASPSEFPPQPMSPPPAMIMQMQAARAQIAEALQRELSAWQAPADEGACAISAQPESRLACDNETLMLAISP